MFIYNLEQKYTCYKTQIEFEMNQISLVNWALFLGEQCSWLYNHPEVLRV